MVGTSFPYLSYLPPVDKVRCVQIDINPARLGLRYPASVGLVGDARETLRALLPLVERKPDRSFLQQAQRTMQEWWRLIKQRGTVREMPMRPAVFAWELGQQLRDDAIICADSGSNTMYAALEIKMRANQRFNCSGLMASMGCALPYAIGAQVAFPDRQVVAFAGDGGLTMSLGELATCTKYGLPIKVFVMKNNVLGMIRWEQMMYMGNPEYGVELQDIDFAMVAEACGMLGLHVEEPAEVAHVVEKALQSPRPALVEAVTDPYAPMVPAGMKPQLAEKYAQALRKGEPNAERIGITLFRETMDDFEQNQQTMREALEKEVPEIALQAERVVAGGKQ
jgi:pyruvate dehydrogenase (quinone)/pyruvate oxidase